MHSLHPALRLALGAFFYPVTLLSVSIVRAPIQVLTGCGPFRRLFEAGLDLGARKVILCVLAMLWLALLAALPGLLEAGFEQLAVVLLWLASLVSASCWMRFPRSGVTGYISWDRQPGRVQLHLCTPLGNRKRAIRNDFLALLHEVDALPTASLVYASPLHGHAQALRHQEQLWWRNLERARMLARWTLARDAISRPRSAAGTLLYFMLYGYWTNMRGTRLVFSADGPLPRVHEGVIELIRQPANT